MKKSLIIFLITAMVAAAPIQSFAAKPETKPNPDIGVEQEEPELEKKEKTLSGTGQTEEIVEEFLNDEVPELEKWYQSLSPKQKGFAQRKGIERIEKEELAKLESRKRGLEDIQNYLVQKLQKSSYTYLQPDLNIDQRFPVLEIGVPSIKAMEKVEKQVELYEKQKRLEEENVACPLYSETVEVDYRLCKYSLKELEKAKSETEKNSEFTKLEQNAPIPIKITKGYLEFYCVKGKPKGFDNWLKKSEYQDMIVVKENQKPLNTDTAGL